MKSWLIVAILMLSSSVAAFQSALTERVHLELGNTKITEDGEPVIEVGGKCGGGQVLAFHLPGKGWYVSSVEPFPGYDFQKIGKLSELPEIMAKKIATKSSLTARWLCAMRLGQ